MDKVYSFCVSVANGQVFTGFFAGLSTDDALSASDSQWVMELAEFLKRAAESYLEAQRTVDEP